MADLKDALRRSPALYTAAKGLRDGGRHTIRAARRTRWLATRSRTIRRYLASHEMPMLSIGTGESPRPGWLNTDLNPAQRDTVYVDATRRFPFDDETFALIHTEHMIEHVAYTEARFMIHECLRVLRPGGRVRIATPDFEQLARLYLDRHTMTTEQFAYTDWTARTFLGEEYAEPIFVVNEILHGWGHRFIFDQELLESTLAAAGFKDPRRFTVGESDQRELRALEAHGDFVGNRAANIFDTLVIEAQRPE